ncbi:MAG TPA: argininosuccinate lyase [Thermoleophilia bacterium]|nr:argininosuccinate lyase [Thermoleophilia bacterium]
MSHRDEDTASGAGAAGHRPSDGTGRREKAWGGRFAESQAPLFERMNASLPFDYVLGAIDVRGSAAHVRMLGKIGVLTDEETGILLEGLATVSAEIEAGDLIWDLGDEDVHMAVERRLTELVGPVGGKVHTGRSRNDQVALDLQLYLRQAVAGHLTGILDLRDALLGRAESWQDVVVPGYTHLQRAQPVSLAHHVLAYVAMLERDTTRFLNWHESSWMPLGAGALAGVNYALDREMVARELGFARVAPNAMDAVSSRDSAFEYVAAATACALNLSRFAEEIVLWSSQEFGFFSLPDSWSSGSSIMPQKRNPDAAELVRGKAAGFLGRLTSLGALSKGLPLAYNKDLQEDKLYVFATREELDLCLQAMAAMVRVVSVDRERARLAAEGGYSQATDVADLLVAKGLPFREAHHVVGRLVAFAHAAGKSLAEISPQELAGLSPLFDQEYYDAVDLERVVGAKVSPGGTSPQRVAEQLTEARSRVDDARIRVREVRS